MHILMKNYLKLKTEINSLFKKTFCLTDVLTRFTVKKWSKSTNLQREIYFTYLIIIDPKKKR